MTIQAVPKIARALVVLVAALAFAGGGAAAELVEGKTYHRIPNPQPTETGRKIEVIEFFSYGCPHCFHMSPVLADWKKTMPANAVLVKVPVSLGRREWGQLVRAYYALERTGDLERLDATLFEAIHVKGQQLYDLDSLAAWAAQNGVDNTKFRNEFTSQEVTQKALWAEQLSREYKVNGIPTITVAGKYRAIGKDFPDMLRITTELVEQASK